MTVSVCSVGAAEKEGVAVCFEFCEGNHLQRERLVISASQFAAMKITCGPCDRTLYEQVAHGAKVYFALGRGLASLGYGACSSGALVRKLVAKGVEREIAEEAVTLLCADGYLCDAENAAREAEKGVAKGWGKRRILSSLYEKKYADFAIRAAMAHLESMEIDFEALCAEQMAKRCRTLPETPSEREKLFAAMMRQGFSTDEIRRAYAGLHRTRD